MIEVAADKSTRNVREGAAERGCRRRAAQADKNAKGSAWDAGEDPADCRALSAESCHDLAPKQRPVMMDVMTGLLYFPQGCSVLAEDADVKPFARRLRRRKEQS